MPALLSNSEKCFSTERRSRKEGDLGPCPGRPRTVQYVLILSWLLDSYGAGFVLGSLAHRIESRIGEPVGAGFSEVEGHPDHSPRDLIRQARLDRHFAATRPHQDRLPVQDTQALRVIGRQVCRFFGEQLVETRGPTGLCACMIVIETSSRAQHKGVIPVGDLGRRGPVGRDKLPQAAGEAAVLVEQGRSAVVD